MPHRYVFQSPLEAGIIKQRPNRFVMMVESKGKMLRCRCPVPTKIGNIKFEHVPCLLSKTISSQKTSHTVEAIYIHDSNKKGFWVGINQTKINAVCEHFFISGLFSRLVKKCKFARDAKYGNSRIDFVLPNMLLEIKTPLTVLPTKNPTAGYSNYTHDGDYARTIKHCSTLTRFAHSGRAIVLLAYLYSAPLFDPIKQNGNNKRLLNAFRLAQKSGVEFWQANFGIDRKGIRLIKYCRLCDKDWFSAR